MISEKPKIIYIAGKVTGAGDRAAITQKFGTAQIKLQQKGYKALNPLAVVNDWRCTWEHAMRLCIAALMTADECYFLKDWQESRGARIEHQLAQELGMKITYEKAANSPGR